MNVVQISHRHTKIEKENIRRFDKVNYKLLITDNNGLLSGGDNSGELPGLLFTFRNF